MDFVIGGCRQGKLAYVMEHYGCQREDIWFPGRDAYGQLEGKHCLCGMHQLIRQMMQQGEDVRKGMERLFLEHPFAVVISDEIGCGIVPADPFEREYRETVGRVSCGIAAKADQVIRIVSGIPWKIK